MQRASSVPLSGELRSDAGVVTTEGGELKRFDHTVYEAILYAAEIGFTTAADNLKAEVCKYCSV